MIDKLQQLIAAAMNRVHVNRIEPATRDGATAVVKRRRFGASVAIWFGNRFLALAQSGVHMFVHARAWAEWEIYCADLLYPERPATEIGHGSSVVMPKLGGVSLREMLRRNDASVPAFAAAARELRRVHQIPCSHFKAAWSQGDLHLDNILYDPAADRAFLIDFDTRHNAELPEIQRHADDLKVMLLELIGWPDERWIRLATALLEEYREPLVLEELDRQLVVPRGFAKVLWHTRTYGIPTREAEQRLHQAREIVHKIRAITAIAATSQVF